MPGQTSARRFKTPQDSTVRKFIELSGFVALPRGEFNAVAALLRKERSAIDRQRGRQPKFDTSFVEFADTELGG
jgi:hypothetical protein